MLEPLKGGRALLDDIEQQPCPAPTLWYLGHAGFVLKYRDAVIYVDPYLSDHPDRLMRAPFRSFEVTHAGLVLATHAHPGHLDPGTAPAILAASRRAKLVLPKAAAAQAHAMGIAYERMVTTDAALRVEFLDDRIYAVPSAHPGLDWTPGTGYPHLGYLVRFGNFTIYHAGDCVPYAGLAGRLRPYTPNVALLPIGGRGRWFDIPQAAQLAEEIRAEWLVPMHYDMFPASAVDVNRFIEHMLGQRPAQRFKVFQCGERWTLPPVSASRPAPEGSAG